MRNKQNTHRKRSHESPRTFMATPRTLGQQFLFTLYLWYARPAFNTGLSMRPPPATMPDSTVSSRNNRQDKLAMHWQYDRSTQ